MTVYVRLKNGLMQDAKLHHYIIERLIYSQRKANLLIKTADYWYILSRGNRKPTMLPETRLERADCQRKYQIESI